MTTYEPSPEDAATSRGVLAESLCDVANGAEVWLLLSQEMREQWMRQADLVITQLTRFGHVVVHKDIVGHGR